MARERGGNKKRKAKTKAASAFRKRNSERNVAQRNGCGWQKV